MTELSTSSFRPDGERRAGRGGGAAATVSPPGAASLGRLRGGRALLHGGRGGRVVSSSHME